MYQYRSRLIYSSPPLHFKKTVINFFFFLSVSYSCPIRFRFKEYGTFRCSGFFYWSATHKPILVLSIYPKFYAQAAILHRSDLLAISRSKRLRRKIRFSPVQENVIHHLLHAFVIPSDNLTSVSQSSYIEK